MDTQRLEFVIEAANRSRSAFAGLRRSITEARGDLHGFQRAAEQAAAGAEKAFLGAGRSASGAFRQIQAHASGVGGVFGGLLRAGASLGSGLLSTFREVIGVLTALRSAAGSVFSGISALVGSVVNAVGALASSVLRLTGVLGGSLLSVAATAFKAIATGAAGAVAAVTGALVYLGKTGVGVNMTLTRLNIGFSTMFHNAAVASRFLNVLRGDAEKSGTSFLELAQQASKLLAFRFSPGAARSIGQTIRDAVRGMGGDSGMADRLILALGQMRAKQKASAEEMMQLTEAGIPAWEMLARAIGKTTAETMDLASKGAIPASVAINAVVAGMRQMFGGLDAQIAGLTLEGRLGNTWDVIQRITGKVTTGFTERLRQASGAVLEFFSNLENTAAGKAIIGALTQGFNAAGDAVARLTGLMPAAARWLASVLHSKGFANFQANAVGAIRMVWGYIQQAAGWIQEHWGALWEFAKQRVHNAVGVVGGAIAGLHAVIQALGQQGVGVFNGLTASIRNFAAGSTEVLGNVIAMLARLLAMGMTLSAFWRWNREKDPERKKQIFDLSREQIRAVQRAGRDAQLSGSEMAAWIRQNLNPSSMPLQNRPGLLGVGARAYLDFVSRWDAQGMAMFGFQPAKLNPALPLPIPAPAVAMREPERLIIVPSALGGDRRSPYAQMAVDQQWRQAFGGATTMWGDYATPAITQAPVAETSQASVAQVSVLAAETAGVTLTVNVPITTTLSEAPEQVKRIVEQVLREYQQRAYAFTPAGRF